jgi:hypothetical protein
MDLRDHLVQAIERKMDSHFLFATIAHIHMGASHWDQFLRILAILAGFSASCIEIVLCLTVIKLHSLVQLYEAPELR